MESRGAWQETRSSLSVASRVSLFSLHLFKNIASGLVVFEAYEKSLEIATEPSSGAVSAHFLSGGVAGAAHAATSASLDMVTRPLALRPGWHSLLPGPWSPSLHRLGYSAIHHSIAHSVLFGTYEGLRRPLMMMTNAPSFPFKPSPQSKETEPIDDEDDEDDVFINNTQLGCTALAGGLAGSLQHVVSHYTEVIEVEAQFSLQWLAKRMRASPVPAPGAAVVAAMPSAIGFVAYEYGRDFSEAVMDNDSSS